MANEAHKYLLALGANIVSPEGGPAVTLRSAVVQLQNRSGGTLVFSPLYQTPCFPAGAGPDYVNAAASLWSRLAPQDLLDLVHEIEADFARERQQRWGQRSLDIDLIACDDRIVPDRAVFDHWRTLPLSQQMSETPDQLILPHPRLQDRAFVLVPMADIAPDWRHPVLELTIAEMLSRLPQADRDEVVRL